MKKQYIMPSMKAHKIQPATVLAESVEMSTTTLGADDFANGKYEIDTKESRGNVWDNEW